MSQNHTKVDLKKFKNEILAPNSPIKEAQHKISENHEVFRTESEPICLFGIYNPEDNFETHMPGSYIINKIEKNTNDSEIIDSKDGFQNSKNNKNLAIIKYSIEENSEKNGS